MIDLYALKFWYFIFACWSLTAYKTMKMTTDLNGKKWENKTNADYLSALKEHADHIEWNDVANR